MCKIYVKFDIHPEDFLADLTYAVYQVVLKAGLSVPFISMELDLQSALREIIRKKMLVSDETENSGSRLFNEAEPWSLDAKTIFETAKASSSHHFTHKTVLHKEHSGQKDMGEMSTSESNP